MSRSSKDVNNCSSASSVTSSFYFEGDDEEKEDGDEREVKFEPMPVKVEILDEEHGDQDGDYKPEDWGARNSKRKCSGRNTRGGNKGGSDSTEVWGEKSVPSMTTVDKKENGQARMQLRKQHEKETTNFEERPPPKTLEQKRADARERMRLLRLRKNGETEPPEEEGETKSAGTRRGRPRSNEDGERPSPISIEERRRKMREHARLVRLQEKGTEKEEERREMLRERARERLLREKGTKKDEERKRKMRERARLLRQQESKKIETDEESGRSSPLNVKEKDANEKEGKRRGRPPSKGDGERPPPMTIEERRKKMRERARLVRLQEKGTKKEEERRAMLRERARERLQREKGTEKDEERKRKMRERARLLRQQGNEKAERTSRMSVGEKSEEEKEVIRRGRPPLNPDCERLPPMTIEERREKMRERMRLVRLREKEEGRTKKKSVSGMTEAEKEVQRAKWRVQAQKKRERLLAKATPEQKRELIQKVSMYRIAREAKMSEDELRIERMHKYLQYQARLASLPPEEVERRKQDRREKARKRWENKKGTPEERERYNEKQREWRKNMTPEQKRRYAEKMRQAFQAAKLDPEKMAKRRERAKIDRQRQKEQRRRQRLEKAGGSYSKSVQDQILRRRKPVGGGGGGVKKCKDLNRNREMERLAHRKRWIEKKLKIQQMLDSGMTMEEAQEQIEGPEKRKRRLIFQRITKLRRNLQKRLRACGTDEEEIERQVKEMEDNYQPVMEFKPYIPKPGTQKRVDQTDLEMLEMEVMQIKTENPVSSLLLDTDLSVAPAPPIQTSAPVVTVTPPKKRGRPPNKYKHFLIPNPEHEQQNMDPRQPEQHTSAGVVSFLQPYQPTTQHLYQSSVRENYVPATASTYAHQQELRQSHHISQTYPIQPNITTSSANVVTIHQTLPSHYSAGHTENTTSTKSQHTDFANCQSGDSGNDYSPHASPPPGDHDDEVSIHTSSPLPQEKPRKKKKQYPRKPVPGRRFRGKRCEVVRDMICDECGEAFNQLYLKRHRAIAHNPNYDYKNKVCVVCKEKFTNGSVWWKHYKETHDVPQKIESCEKEKGDYLCPECGKNFKVKQYLQRHHFYAHGEGSKEENWYKCPICPIDRVYREFCILQRHIIRYHPSKLSSVTSGKHTCGKCDGDFLNDRELREHVRTTHPQEYFPCDFCLSVKFSRLALNFHYGRCNKMPREIVRERAEKWAKEGKGAYNMERIKIRCAVCEIPVCMDNLVKHYKLVHGVQEEKNFTCPDCPKEFFNRAYLAGHLEEIHCKKFEEIEEHLRPIHVRNKEGLKIQTEPVKRGPRKKVGGIKKQIRRRRRNFNSSEDEEVDAAAAPTEMKSEDGEGDGHEEMRRKRRPKRNIVVVCEEDVEIRREEQDEITVATAI